MNKKELKKAFEEGIITEEKFKEELFKLETQTKEKKKAKRIYEAVTEEEFIKLLKVTEKPHHKLAFILAYGGGLRVSEIVNLKREDIKIKEKKIFIRQAKGSKDRITICPKWIKEKHLQYIPIKTGQRGLQAIFLRKTLKIKINRVIDTFKRNGKEVPIYRLHLHCLRHSFATRLLEKKVPVNQVQLLLGHENLATTSQYTKANPSDAIASVMEVE